MEELKSIKRFDVKKEIKVHTALKKVFNEEQNIYSEDESLNMDNITVLNTANTVSITSLSDEAKLILRRYKLKEDLKSYTEIDYTITDNHAKVKIAADYLKDCINILYASGDVVLLTTKTDYPLKLENKHFRILIAPRIDND